MFFGQEYNATRFNHVLKQLKLNPSKVKSEFYTEKKMPNAEDSFIAVVPFLKEKIEEDYLLYQNYIVITDAKGEIKSKYLDPAEITSDAIMLEGFTIDTGLYHLNSEVRAFGVIANYRNGSGPNPHSSADISLYYSQGKTLKKVLSQYNVYTSGAEWDMKCNGEFSEDRSVIILDEAKSNGFANLKIKTETTEKIGREVNGDCTEKKTMKTSLRTLKFDKSAYK